MTGNTKKKEIQLPATAKKHIKTNALFCIIKKSIFISFSVLSLLRQLFRINYFIILLITVNSFLISTVLKSKIVKAYKPPWITWMNAKIEDLIILKMRYVEIV